MIKRESFLIGSCNTGNVQRMRLKLEGEAELSVVDSWEEFEREVGLDVHSIQITDLNLRDCFRSVVLDGILKLNASKPVIIFLEKQTDWTTFSKHANLMMEILPLKIVDDDSFVSILRALLVKRKYIGNLL